MWLNPPYGRHTITWLAKMNDHRNGVALIFARTDTRWFHLYAVKADAILFLRGRIAFIDGQDNTKQQGSTAASMLLAWGTQSIESLKKMKAYGFLVSPE